MKNLSQEGVLLLALISYSVKLMISGATFADAACLAALGTLSSIFYYIKHNKAKIVERDQLEEVTKQNAELTSSFGTVETQLNAIKDSLTKLNDAVEAAVPTASSVTASTASAVPKAAASTETLSTMNIEAFNSLMGYTPTTTEDKQNFITKLEKLKATGTSTEEDKNRIVRINGKINKLNTP